MGDVELAGKVALVTGASRGIGRAIVELLLAEGMVVIGTARDAERLAALEAEIGCERLSVVAADLAVPADVEQLFARARERVEGLNLLVNNAGLGLFGACDALSVEEWDTMMDINARGALLCAQEAFRWMKSEGGGRIINISSVVGHKGYENQIGYAASKHALMGITKVMGREGQAHGIRCSVICPGGVATEMVTQARPDLDPAGLIQPYDVARAVRYLATEPESVCTDELHLRRAGSTPFA